MVDVTFTLLPAVDVAGGRAVRLAQGEPDTDGTDCDPRDAALGWQAAGAEWTHLVDVDAAFGRSANAELVAAMIGELDVQVQLSGGIHDDASLEWALTTACARVNVGTAALADRAWCARAIAAHGERVAVSLADVAADVAAAGANPEGAVIAKALYAGRFTLAAALDAMRRRVRSID